jgi:hypothetical protein
VHVPIVRRFRKAAAQQNWFAVAIDFTILVAGVFLGLQANNWNQERLKRELAKSYRSRLIDDLTASERAAMASVRYYTDVRTHALAALTALNGPKEGLGTPFLIDAYEAMQMWPRSGKHSTYDEILSSGDAELMGSPVVRDRISNFYWTDCCR